MINLRLDPMQFDFIIEKLDALVSVGTRRLGVEIEILEALAARPKEVVAFKLKTGESNMPLTLPFGDQDQFFVSLSVNGAPVGAFPNGPDGKPQTASVTSSDPNTVTLTLDTTAEPDTDGTVTVASGTVIAAGTPAQPNVPITVTLNINNADGSVAASATDTVTVSKSAIEATGILFGTPVPVPAKSISK